MLTGRSGGEINDITRQAIPCVNDTFCKELRSGRAAATVLKNFKRMMMLMLLIMTEVEYSGCRREITHRLGRRVDSVLRVI